MKLDSEAQQAVRQLGEAINKAIENSERVADAIEHLRRLGYEPNLMLKLEIGLQELQEIDPGQEEFPEEIELDLTEEDLRTLRRMKIIIE
ncbi:MAG: hypothetical protein R2747_20340 [Pyrinomonadaceae bacterium]